MPNVFKSPRRSNEQHLLLPPLRRWINKSQITMPSSPIDLPNRSLLGSVDDKPEILPVCPTRMFNTNAIFLKTALSYPGRKANNDSGGFLQSYLKHSTSHLLHKTLLAMTHQFYAPLKATELHAATDENAGRKNICQIQLQKTLVLMRLKIYQ